jgi:hypothetical protein
LKAQGISEPLLHLASVCRTLPNGRSPHSRRTYDYRIQEAICESGDRELFPELKIPRSTIRSWIPRGTPEVIFCDDEFRGVAIATGALQNVMRRSGAEFFRVLKPGGRLLVSLINPPFEVMSKITRRGSRMMGQPLFWPTRSRMRRQTQAAGFRVESQRKVFRVPAGMILPSVLTVAVRPD